MATPAAKSTIYGEEIHRIAIGQGIYTSELASNIPDGFSAQAYNLVATGDSLENRSGLRPSSVDYHKSYTGYPNGVLHYFSQLNFGNVNYPIIAWGASDGVSHTLSFIRAKGTGSGDGYMEVSMPNPIWGVAQYNDRVYFVEGNTGVRRIDSFNWVADSISYTSITTVVAPLGLFSFKDRLWGWWADSLYFTNIAATGGYPETWSATNTVSIRGQMGRAAIIKVVPLQNKLIIFTEAGLYTLLVEGDPTSWILRVLDITSIQTHPQSVFESKGIVYYVNQAGVWATNGISVTKLSGVIEDQFFLAKGRRVHTLFEYEDGMILTISKVNDDSSFDAPNCKMFYSKLQPIGWTEWGIHPPDGESNNWGNNRLVAFIAMSKKIPTFLNSDPTVYALAVISDSSATSIQTCRMQLLIFDGGENKGRNRVGDLITDPLRVHLKTKFMDGGNPYALKRNKMGMLELYTSDVLHQFSASWDYDLTTGPSNRIPSRPSFRDISSGQSSNLILLPADFHFRRCAFNFSSSLQTNESQLKIKDLAIRMETERPEFEQTR